MPIGERAQNWIDKYMQDVRPTQFACASESALFLGRRGLRWSPSQLGETIGQYVRASGIDKEGACHIFRHTCATLMLENGADVRFIQQLLGHSRLDSTQIYTQVSIKKLKEVHEKTHPAK